MQSLINLGEKSFKLYHNDKVYSPEYSSLGTVALVDKLIKDGKKPNTTVLDVGCGSGLIGLGVKKLNAFSDITLCDVDPEAIRVSKLNAKRLGLAVSVLEANMLPKLGNWDIICANLPTYTMEDMEEQELHGPLTAYYGGAKPLSLYAELFDKAKGRCKALVCECQAKYQEPFLTMAGGEGWTMILSSEFSFAFLPPQ